MTVLLLCSGCNVTHGCLLFGVSAGSSCFLLRDLLQAVPSRGRGDDGDAGEREEEEERGGLNERGVEGSGRREEEEEEREGEGDG